MRVCVCEDDTDLALCPPLQWQFPVSGATLHHSATGCMLLPGSGRLLQELGFKLQANGFKDASIVLQFQGRKRWCMKVSLKESHREKY